MGATNVPTSWASSTSRLGSAASLLIAFES